MINASNGKAEFKEGGFRRARGKAKQLELLPQLQPVPAKLVFESTDKKLSVTAGDNYILLDKDKEKDYIFRNHGWITDVKKPKLLPLTDELKEKNEVRKATGQLLLSRYEHTLELEVKKPLTDNNELDDYAYSLLAVDRYLKPEAHFWRKLTKLDSFDFQTITEGMIYVSRTAFGRLVNALPVENKHDFSLHAIEHFGKLEFKDIDYIEAVELLQQYIEQNILSQGRYLMESERILREELKETGLPISGIGFGRLGSDEDGATLRYNRRFSYFDRKDIDDVSDTLEPQALLLRSLFHFEETGNVMKRLRESVAVYRNEEMRFRDMFAAKNWPLDIKE